MYRTLPAHAADYFGPAIGGLAFIVLMSGVKEPARRAFNAILVAGAMGAYLSGGLGPWELAFAALGTVVAYRALGSYRLIGVAWLMHSAWDLVHHFFGNPIWPFMETSSFGCCIFDAVIAAWFVAGAPPLVSWGRRSKAAGSGAGVEMRSGG
jgi:hypothetical protein